jgi:sugar lactone lactonase YvrE
MAFSRAVAVVLLASPAVVLAQPLTGRWRAFADSAEQARVRGDWPVYARLIDSVYRAGLGNHPTVIWAQARAAAKLGDRARAFERLRTYAAMGLWRNLRADSAFATLASDPEYRTVGARIDTAAHQPQRATLAFELPDSAFTPESIAYDSRTGRFFLSSIRHGSIAARSKDGHWSTFVASGASGLGAHFGLALDSVRRVLWVCGSQLPISDSFVAADSGASGVAAFDLDRGTRLARVVSGRGPTPHAYGDIAVLPDGSLLVSDATGGGLYRASRGVDTLATVVPAGQLRSPQGIVVAPEPHTVWVADYTYGLVRVDLQTGALERLARPDSVAVTGIDGLIRVGDGLVGVQNGTAPERLVRIELAGSPARITAVRILEASPTFLDEPTHLVLVDGRIYFVANSGFGRYDDAGKLKPGETIARARIGLLP